MLAGQAEVEVGEKWLQFSAAVQNRFMGPLHDFMANDLKAVAVCFGSNHCLSLSLSVFVSFAL